MECFCIVAVIEASGCHFATGPLCGFLCNWVSYLVGGADSAIGFKIVVQLNEDDYN